MAYVCRIKSSSSCKRRWGREDLPAEPGVCHACARDLESRGMTAAGYPRPLVDLAARALGGGFAEALHPRRRAG